MALGGEERARLAQVAVEGETALGEQAELVEELVDLARGLMNGAYDGGALAGRQLLHDLGHRERHEAVQTARRLVAEQYRRIGNDLFK